MADKKLNLTIITPGKSVYDDAAVSVVAPAFDGEMGVKSGHAPLMALLGTGILKVWTPEDGKKHFAIRGGFLQVSNNKLVVLTPEAAEASDIKEEDVTKDAEEWQDKKAITDEDIEAKAQAMSWVTTRKKLLTS